MKLSKLIYIVAIVIVGAWLLGLILKAAAWLISGLVYLAGIVIATGLVYSYFENKKRQK